MPKLAVVIPLYNHEPYIEAAIASVLSQSLPPDRIIVVDDGSTDAGADRVEQLAHPRVELHRQPNSGAHEALNRGIALAEGCDFVAILNSDDLYLPDRLAACIGDLESKPSIDAIFTGVELIDAAGVPLAADHPKVRWVRRLWSAPHDPLAGWLGYGNATKTTSNLVGRRDYFVRHPFQPYRYVHDWFFAVTAAWEGKLGCLPGAHLQYRTHPANTIKENKRAVIEEVLQMNLDLLRANAPLLASDPTARLASACYFRSLLGNHSDFRAELFVAILAQQLMPGEIRLETGDYPEFAAPASKHLAKQEATATYRAMLQCLATSRWMALGRLLGIPLDFPLELGEDSGSHDSLKTVLECSRWIRFGRRMGFLTLPSNE